MVDNTPLETAVVKKPLARRTFIKAIGGAGLGFALWGRFPNGEIKALAAIPGGTLDVVALPKFVDPMIIPPAMPPSGPNPNVYDIEVVQFDQQVLPTGYRPKTTVWSYGAFGKPGTRNFPAFTLETTRGQEIEVTWRNGLSPTGPHLLPVDPTLHWANPDGPPDQRPNLTGKTYLPPAEYDLLPADEKANHYTDYRGPVPIITHVHGMERAYEWSDGYPEAWYLPAGASANNTVGSKYRDFETKSGGTWPEGAAVFKYPNTQRDSNAWYHDHTLGMTRLNVYAGPAGFYFVRDPNEQPTTKPKRNSPGGPAVLPGPAPTSASGPFDTDIYEIPIAIQDRSFNDNGSLFYPADRAFFDGYLGDFIPESGISPVWNPEFFGNTLVANGRTWPYLEVEPRRYRFRLLNGCQSRFLVLAFPNKYKDLTFTMIGNEGGYLRKQVDLPQVLLGPAERADVIIDFSKVKFGESVTMLNLGPDAPFAGLPVRGQELADPRTTGQVMEFRVTRPMTGNDPSTPPGQLVLPDIPRLGPPDKTRQIALLEQMDPSGAFVEEALLGVIEAGTAVKKLWMDPATETPAAGSTEEWEIYNTTVDAHPIHVHETFFEVINREPFDPATFTPLGAARPPELWEDGLKDTVIAYPGEITRIRMQFGNPGLFVWHCHIVEHEDNEMMRPYTIT